MKVYFFSTCIGAAAFADTCVNSIKLLQKEALHNMNLFKGNEPIILPSGSCTGMMKVDYIELFEGSEYESQAREFSSRIYELSEFLDKVLKVRYEDRGAPTKVTWHSNCHALRSAKCIDSAKNLIKSLNNVELIELEREEECCGFGGTFSVKEPEISNAMVTQKVQDIASRGVEYILSADSGCLLNISGTMKKQGVNVKPMHLYDFLAQRIGL